MEPYSYQLKHDQDGRIMEKTEIVEGASIKWTYEYDKAGRLAEAKLGDKLICQCQYHKQGRRSQDYFPHLDKQTRRYQYTVDDRLLSAGNNGFTHDKQGFALSGTPAASTPPMNTRRITVCSKPWTRQTTPPLSIFTTKAASVAKSFEMARQSKHIVG